VPESNKGILGLRLTAHGIWGAERIGETVDYDSLPYFIAHKSFDCFSDLKASLDDKEKVLLFVMLAVRAFSAETGVNLRREVSDATWKAAVEEAAAFLRGRGFVGEAVMSDVLEFEAKGTSIKPLRHFFRYAEYIPRKTPRAALYGVSYVRHPNRRGRVRCPRQRRPTATQRSTIACPRPRVVRRPVGFVSCSPAHSKRQWPT
jgi:hypothetical protein